MDPGKYIKLPEKFQTLWALFFLSAASLLLQQIIFKHVVGTKVLMPWLLFFSLMLFMKPYASALFVFLVEVLLVRVHLIKLSFTNTPFDASDLYSWRHAIFLKNYTDHIIPLILMGMVFCVVKGISLKKRQYTFLPIFLLLMVSCVQESRPTEVNTNPINWLFRLARVTYVDWNLATNIKENGILNHVFLTLPKGERPQKGALPYVDDRAPAVARPDQDSPDVFLILCESCYTSSGDSFVTPISRLKDEGFSHATVVSPVYGGMTAEAEYEVLTGLPSRRYKGIDFQYFAEQFSSTAKAVPRIFAQSGYSTFSSHLNGGFFWKRDVVHPKFGFEKSYFVDKKDWPGRDEYPEDEVLFRDTLRKYQENLKSGKKTFSFLITIYTHGPYAETKGDGGEQVYRQKMEKTTNQFIEFQKAAAEMAANYKRPVVFVIFGDHKPAMTVAFYKKHEFNDDFFIARGSKNESFLFSNLSNDQQMIFGNVPLYVKSYGMEDRTFSDNLVNQMQNRPLFCLPALVSRDIGLHEPFYNYVADLCNNKAPESLVDSRSLRASFPEEVYGERLF